MNLSTLRTNIGFDDRADFQVSNDRNLISRLSKLPLQANDNGGQWYLEAGFGHADESGVQSLADWQFLKVRIAPR